MGLCQNFWLTQQLSHVESTLGQKMCTILFKIWACIKIDHNWSNNYYMLNQLSGWKIYKICGKCKIFLEAVYMIFKYGKRQAADDEGPLYLPTL